MDATFVNAVHAIADRLQSKMNEVRAIEDELKEAVTNGTYTVPTTKASPREEKCKPSNDSLRTHPTNKSFVCAKDLAEKLGIKMYRFYSWKTYQGNARRISRRKSSGFNTRNVRFKKHGGLLYVNKHDALRQLETSDV